MYLLKTAIVFQGGVTYVVPCRSDREPDITNSLELMQMKLLKEPSHDRLTAALRVGSREQLWEMSIRADTVISSLKVSKRVSITICNW